MTDLKSEELWNILIMEKIKFHLEKYINPLLKSNAIEVDEHRKKVRDGVDIMVDYQKTLINGVCVRQKIVQPLTNLKDDEKKEDEDEKKVESHDIYKHNCFKFKKISSFQSLKRMTSLYSDAENLNDSKLHERINY